MNKKIKRLAGAVLTMATTFMMSFSAYAAEAEGSMSNITGKAFAASVAIAIAAGAGAIGMGMAISKAVDGVARQPEANTKIQTLLMLGLVFVETAIIYALIVAILIIFVL